ncbi:MAG: DUF2063 domain-containing protein [Salinarimonadaceae bacterium]|nr:MAG: DUF2063 domain-containing protein [Salinarimonadaceae bacterium]
MPALRDSQSDFARGLFGGDLPANVAIRDPAIAKARFAVYRNNVVVGLAKALATRFPAVERLVGEEFFTACARLFVEKHPPRSRLMMRYGEDFPAFLAGFEPAAGLPYLPDVARLEFALGEAYHAADATPVAIEALVAAAGRDPESLRLMLHPSLRIVASPHPIVTIWRMNQPGATPEPIAQWSGETAIVSRPALAVRVEAAEPAYVAFIDALSRDPGFASAAEAAFSTDDAFDPGAALARAVAGGLVISID